MTSENNTGAPQRVSLESLLPFIEAAFESGKTFTVPITGTSMLPLLVQGRDKVEIEKPALPLKIGDLPLYRRKDGSFVLHRVVGIENGTYTMCGDNQFLLEKGIADEQIIGVTAALIQNGKKIPVTDEDYLAYVAKMNRKLGTRYPYRRLRYKLSRALKKGNA